MHRMSGFLLKLHTCRKQITALPKKNLKNVASPSSSEITYLHYYIILALALETYCKLKEFQHFSEMLNYKIQLFKPAEFEIKVLWNEKACLKKKNNNFIFNKLL